MAARRRSAKTRELPPNLYVRNGYYSYRDPGTGKEYGLGRDKRYAINEAVAANMAIYSSQGVSLIDRINNVSVIMFDEVLANFREEIARRKLKPSTLKRHNHQLMKITDYFSGTPLNSIDVRMVSGFLEERANGGKYAIANQFRALLSDIFRTAIATGLTSENPAAATRPFKTELKRSRLLLGEYLEIHKQAGLMSDWLPLCLDLALVTGQRESDLAAMRWSDIVAEKLCVIQSKTGAMLKISTTTGIDRLGVYLGDVLENLRAINGGHDKILGGKSVSAISERFRAARSATGLKWEGDPPPFHEVRSLSGRLYAEERGKDFAQAILGHKTSAMTDKYRDGRGREWKEILV
ncbi:integrase [Cronobacter sakazakii]|uniref:phage integrase Arm DNA-binding domain-containing protein n=1 Tax=Cronobacter TaxID=413496 RepID=UPI000A105325|nr:MULTISPECIES: phage integrase Arm DNA-binding domain-containing protein [Cronobacter]EJH4501937.1 phage integrase Arm DNA-binding domain-containing protein [Cronobacter sakazakii]EJV9474167.1 phage integrase Arm DNA-binding domain-containing protein [Cronobacter sakazakii]ELY6360341.1 phage integrase Arm DNA-binding domain-containing protein [Cronobacter sakazakii]NCH41230.1 integrase [Cronobacter sakazakii]NCH54667.1 integrase [Cronobacter muytjensii]